MNTVAIIIFSWLVASVAIGAGVGHMIRTLGEDRPRKPAIPDHALRGQVDRLRNVLGQPEVPPS